MRRSPTATAEAAVGGDASGSRQPRVEATVRITSIGCALCAPRNGGRAAARAVAPRDGKRSQRGAATGKAETRRLYTLRTAGSASSTVRSAGGSVLRRRA